MTRFEFTADGLTLPARIVVVSPTDDLREATGVAEEWARQHYIDPASLELYRSEEVEPPCVVFGWNGEY